MAASCLTQHPSWVFAHRACPLEWLAAEPPRFVDGDSDSESDPPSVVRASVASGLGAPHTGTGTHGQPASGSVHVNSTAALVSESVMPLSESVAAQGCPVSEWSEWSPCDANCGNGSSTRVRYTLPPSLFMSDDHCGRLGPLLQLRPCTSTLTTCTARVEECWFGEWSEWGHCSAACGGGVQSRVRGVTLRREIGAVASAAVQPELTQPVAVRGLGVDDGDGDGSAASQFPSESELDSGSESDEDATPLCGPVLSSRLCNTHACKVMPVHSIAV